VKIFELENNIVTFAPQALLLKPFKVLWDRDKGKGKKKALDELSFIFYMEDVRSDFYDIVDEDERRVEVLKFLTELPSTYKPDKEVLEALEEYAKLSEGMSVKLLKDAIIMINKMREAMLKTDFNERDKSGKPVHDIDKVMRYVERIPILVRSLKESYREIEREAEEEHLMRGGRMKATFEDGIV
jgi:hypothetical protein